MLMAMRTDSDIQKDIEQAVRSDPQIRAEDIAISVLNGVVTLAGFTRSYRERVQAEVNAKRITGVLGVANDIEVRLPLLNRRPDPDIARDAVAALEERLPEAFPKLQVLVEKGWLTIEGDLEWQHLKERAEEAVRDVKGVRAITNAIVVKPQVLPMDIKQKIEAVFMRNAQADAERVSVDTGEDGTIILAGIVSSWAEREQAERTAWSAPGVKHVENRLEVRVV
jgi:osmotically-inducible protein OsmY